VAVYKDPSETAACRVSRASSAHYPGDFSSIDIRNRLGHAFASASLFRKAASPASDTSTHFGAGEASAS
jgi:hypothetical protein